MQVKVGDKVYDDNQEPVMVILSEKDKANIAAMDSNAKKYCSFPDDWSSEKIRKWMNCQNQECATVKEYKSESEHNLSGRGKVFVVLTQDEIECGNIIKIDGKLWSVRGTEYMSYGSFGRSDRVGVVVGEVKED